MPDKLKRLIWEKFTCNNCGWQTYGTYAWEGPPGEHPLPDTDCPKCGFHDSVIGDEGDHPEPPDLEALRQDQRSGPYGW